MTSTMRHSVLRRWEEFWFQAVPPHSFALLRILFGAIGFVSLFGLTPVSLYWPLDALTPIPGSGYGIRAGLLALGVGDLAGRALFFALLASFACMALGYRSSLAVTACFVGSICQSHWNRLPLSSAHHVVIAILFCLLWADCARVWSLDAWLAHRRGRPLPERPAQSVWPLRLIRFQVALIYLNSGLWKLLGEMWRDGSAVHYTLNLNVFHRFPIVLSPAFEVLTTVGTYLTLFWEIGFAFMLFHTRTRRLALLLGVLIHAGLWSTLELGPFSVIMIASYVAFLSPQTVAAFEWQTSRLRGRRSHGQMASRVETTLEEGGDMVIRVN